MPSSFVPLAQSIGNASVTIVHDAAARHALARVRRPAASVGSTILLDRAPDSSPSSVERLAHEVVHAASVRAHPSAPRLFDDPHRDDEERRAHAIGRLARALGPEAVPSLLGSDGTPPAVRPTVIDRDTTRRPARTTTVRRTATPTTSPSTVRREPAASTNAPSTTAATTSSSTTTTSTSAAKTSANASHREPVTARLDRVDELVSMIEARVLAELERRGGRHRGWL